MLHSWSVASDIKMMETPTDIAQAATLALESIYGLSDRMKCVKSLSCVS